MVEDQDLLVYDTADGVTLLFIWTREIEAELPDRLAASTLRT